ncbi:MAG: hypothetical protein IKG89_04440 [Oscillospiraceae bacterium]|nr:hypothetical protein [Oscillospiraceae bacterium]
MSSEYGFSGEMNLDMWNSGTRRASKALDKGDVESALREANLVVDSYLKHRRGTDKWQRVLTFITIAFIAGAIVLGLASGSWLAAIVVGVIGLAFCGFLNTRIVDKRIAVDNAFYDSFEHLTEAINQLSANK